MIIYPDTIKAERTRNGDIILTLGDRKTLTEQRFYLPEETASQLANAILNHNLEIFDDRKN